MLLFIILHNMFVTNLEHYRNLTLKQCDLLYEKLVHISTSNTKTNNKINCILKKTKVYNLIY